MKTYNQKNEVVLTFKVGGLYAESTTTNKHEKTFVNKATKKAQPKKNQDVQEFSEIDKGLFPLLTPPKKRHPEYLAVLQNAFWQLEHEKAPKDDLLKLLMYFSPKVRLSESSPTESTIFAITAKVYAALTGLSLRGAYTALNRVVDALYEHSVIFQSQERGRVRTRLVTSAGYQDGRFTVSFTHYALYIMYVFSKETPFTQLHLKSISALHGHGLRLYPFLVQNAFRQDFDIALSDLKVALELSPTSYPEYRDFKSTILKPHIDLINEQTELSVQFRAVKKEGRKASHVGFTISLKKDVTPKQPESKEPPEQPPEEKEKPSVEQDEQQYAIQFVLDTLKAKNLYDRFKEGNESKVQVMSRILTDMKEGRHIYWQEKIKEFTHSIPLGLDGIGNR